MAIMYAANMRIVKKLLLILILFSRFFKINLTFVITTEVYISFFYFSKMTLYIKSH